EHGREDARVRVADDERRLQARKSWPVASETRMGGGQLVRVRPVLGIIERDELAAAERKRIGERLRLGTRQARRDLDDLDARMQAVRAQRGKCLTVVRLADDLDL